MRDDLVSMNVDHMNHIVAVTLTHHTTPVAVRERLSLDSSQQAALLDELGRGANETAAVVTCNRTEIYCVSETKDAPAFAARLLAKHAGIPANVISGHVRTLHGAEVARHLFRVAAGLDSFVIGEPQILGQVRQAADIARSCGSSGPILERLFNYAIVTGKRARHETSISRGAGSIGYAAVQLARSTLGDLRDRRGLVVGLGEMGQLVARNLASNGLADLQLCNRSAERAELYAKELNATGVSWNDLDEALTKADICITATAAREPLLTRPRLERIVERRDARPLLLIDIAVPRNVDSSAGELSGVHLHDIDALDSIREENLQLRKETIPQVEAIVDQELQAFSEWCIGRATSPVIQKLRERAEGIRGHEVDRALRRLSHLDERDREVVLALSHAITNKMLHEPVTRLKRSPNQDERARATIDLFGLENFASGALYATNRHQD